MSKTAGPFAWVTHSWEFFLWFVLALCLMIPGIRDLAGYTEAHKGDLLLSPSLWWPAIGLSLFMIAVLCRTLFGSWPLRALVWGPDTMLQSRDGMLARLNRELVDYALSPQSGGHTPHNRSRAYLVAMTERSELVSEHSLRRATVLVCCGVLIGAIGVSYFYLTATKDVSSPAGSSAGVILADNFAYRLPRMTILIFIEVLAGFFLKQYRTALEDFRYYETIARRRESIIAALLLHEEFGNDDDVRELSKELIKVPGITVLKQGETTPALESAKLAENEFITLISQLTKLVKEAKASVEKGASKPPGSPDT